jgi:hypothetical protein
MDVLIVSGKDNNNYAFLYSFTPPPSVPEKPSCYGSLGSLDSGFMEPFVRKFVIMDKTLLLADELEL